MTFIVNASNKMGATATQRDTPQEAIECALEKMGKGFSVYILGPDNRKFVPGDFPALLAYHSNRASRLY